MNSTTQSASIPTILWVGIGGAVLAVLGAFLPWVKTPFGSVSGIDGDGSIVAAAAGLAAVVFGLAISKRGLSRTLAIVAALAGAAALATSVYDVFNIKNELGDLGSPGYGLYLCVVGSLAATGVAGNVAIRGQ